MRVCPNDGEVLNLHYVGYVMNYYDCPKCGERFKGFAGDTDEVKKASEAYVNG